LLWKGRNKQKLEWPKAFPRPVALDDSHLHHSATTIEQFARSRKFSGCEKDALLAELAQHLDLDYQELCRMRVMHLITPAEARELAARGVDLQYHTHRHRVYRGRQRMFTELDDNRRRIATFTSNEPRHFCYTAGFYLPEYPDYLKDYGMLSATTSDPGLCTSRTNPHLLPRVLDKMGVSELEFRTWLDGTADLLPKRNAGMDKGQLVEED
jgi:hypothetical protein